jgi:large repetitive protein
MTSRAAMAWVAAGLGLLASPAGAGEVRGRLLVDKKPVSGASIEALALEAPLLAALREARRDGPRKPLATATTKPDGTFALAVAPTANPPAFQLKVSGGGAAPLVLERLFEPAESDDLGDVTVGRAEVLAGRVVDARGGPVVGATVTLGVGTGGGFGPAGDPSVRVTTTTGADGSFRFAAATERGNRLLVEAPGFAMVELSGVRSGALRPLALALGRVVTGTVLLADKRTPVPGALVRFEGTVSGRWAEGRADGTFVLEGLPREGGRIVADAGERGRGSLSAPSGESRSVVVLAPTATLRGRVVDADTGAAIAGIRVTARAGGALFWDRSGKDGRYEIRGLAPGAFRVSADDPRYVPWSREAVAVAAGQPVAQDVPLVRGATLLGRVVDEEGRPIEGATGRVAWSGEHPVRFFMRTMEGASTFRTAKDGTFKAQRLMPGGNQRLTVDHDDYEARTIGGIVLSAGGTKAGITVVLPKGLGVRGVVKDENGQPLPGAEVEMFRGFTFQSGRGASSFSFVGAPGRQPKKQTGPDGRFEFRGLASGDYSLVATKRGYARERIDPVKVAEGRASEPIEMLLKPGAAISGLVKDRAGNGMPGYRLAARASSGGPGPMGPLGGTMTEEPTGPDGSFVIEGLKAGETYELQLLGETGLGPRKSGVTAPAEGVEITVSGKGRIQGVVTDGEGHAVSDFEVAYTPSSRGGGGGMRFSFRIGPGARAPGQMVAVHADDGAFVIEDVPAGTWDVEVSATGYQRGRTAGIAVEEGGTAEGVEVKLAKGPGLAGRVLDARGSRPVSDATVRADLSTGRPRFRMGPDGAGDNETMTDADGRFEMLGLAPGTYTLTASHPSFSEKSETIELKDGPASIEIRLGQGGTVSGTVLSAGRPVVGAAVSLGAAGEGLRGPFGDEQQAVSDDGGRFRFERLNPGRYAATASLRGQSSSPVEVALPTADASQEVSLLLAEGATIRGRVSGLAEAARAGVSVTANGPESYFASTRTGAEGTFELTGAPRGTLNLNARTGDFMTGSRTASSHVTIGEGQTEVAAEIVFEAGFRVDGRVTRGGRPVTDANVSAFPERGGPSASDRTDESGVYGLEGLAEGTYNISAFPMSGGEAPIHRRVPITGDTTVDLEAPVARLAGTVVEAESSRPLSEASVGVEDPEPGFGRRMMTVTDSSGRFQLDGLDPKAYRLVVRKAAYQTETRDATAGDDAEVRVELRRGEGIGLVARDGIFGTPLRGVSVRVVDGAGASVFFGSVSLDSEGRGEIPSLRPGQYEVRIGAGGYAGVTLRGVVVPAPTLSVALTPGGTLEIQIGPETAARPGAKARLLDADGRLFWPGTFPPPDYSFPLTPPVRRWENVAPGHYTLAVDGGLHPECDVREGGTAIVPLP